MFQNAAFNILRPRQDGQHLADDIFKFMFVNGEVAVTIKCIEFLFLMVHLTVIYPAVVRMMACCRTGDKSLS